MKFIERTAITVDDNPNGCHEENCKPFLIGEDWVISWNEGELEFGDERHRLFPAWVNGSRAWVDSWVWNRNQGYCASGSGEKIVSFKKGIELIVVHGNWGMFEDKIDEALGTVHPRLRFHGYPL